jgi:hypothetical protein
MPPISMLYKKLVYRRQMSKPAGGPAHARLATRPSTLTVPEIAWVALLPFAAVAILAIAFLGPAIGDLLLTHTSDHLWPRTWWETRGHPEPVKHGRFLIAALAALLFAAVILAGARWRPALPRPVTRTLVLASYALVLALVAISVLHQNATYYPKEEPNQDPIPPIFGVWRVLVAVTLVLICVALLRRGGRVARFAVFARNSRRVRWMVLALVAAVIATLALKALNSDRSLGVGFLNLPWTLNDAVAVLDGRTPLVNYDPIYAKLLPYLSAPVLSAFGATTIVFTAFMAVLVALALVAVFAIFWRVTRSPLFACALFVPFAATSDISTPIGLGLDAGKETSAMMLASLWPMRYGGAYLLAWLTTRHVDGCRPRSSWILFLVGSVVAVDDLEFGIGALTATVAALLCARPPSSLRDVRSLLANVAGGVLGALALVTVITLVHSGQLPNFGLLFEWPRIFTTLGWFSMPLPTWGLHLVVYATFAAAVAVAAVRLAHRDDDVLLTSMLAWSGVFGLSIGGYFVGRPDVIKLTGMLSAWSFALSMLTVACVRSLAGRGWPRPALPQLLVLFGFALSVSSLAGLSPPQEQIRRLTTRTPKPTYLATAERVIGEQTRHGEKVVVLLPMSYVITHKLGLHNVAPYAFMNAIVTESQMTRLVNMLRREDVRTVFIPAPDSYLLNEGDSEFAQLRLLEAVGFPQQSTAAGIVELKRP